MLEFSRAIDLLVAKYPQYRALSLDRADGAVVAITPGSRPRLALGLTRAAARCP